MPTPTPSGVTRHVREHERIRVENHYVTPVGFRDGVYDLVVQPIAKSVRVRKKRRRIDNLRPPAID